MAMFKSAENLLSSIRDGIFRLPKNNSEIIGYEYVPLNASGTSVALRPPINATKAVMHVEDSGMPLSDPTVNSTPAYLQSYSYTSKILLGRYTVFTPVLIPISSISGAAGTVTVYPSSNASGSNVRIHPLYSSMVVTISGNSVSGFNGTWTIASVSDTFFTFNNATTGTGVGGFISYTVSPSVANFSVGAQRDGIPFYRGEVITIEGYNNLVNFRIAGNPSFGVGLKILYYS